MPRLGHVSDFTSSEPFELLPALRAFLHAAAILPLAAPAPPTRALPTPPAMRLEERKTHSLAPAELEVLLSTLGIQLLSKNSSVPQQDPARLCGVLSRLALLPAFTHLIGEHFGPILPELVARWLIELAIVPDHGVYADRVYTLWSRSHRVDHGQEKDQVEREHSKHKLRQIFSAFALWLNMHPSLFPFLILLLRHPAFESDPFTILPSSVLLSERPEEEKLWPNENPPLFEHPTVSTFLIALHRLLSICPHLPFPGIIQAGWMLPDNLNLIMKHHPRQGMRYLAWRCWRYWLGHTGFGKIGLDARNRYVWRNNASEHAAQSLVESNMAAPWSSCHEHQPAASPFNNPNLVDDSHLQEFIAYDELLTLEWDIRVSDELEHSRVSYQTVTRAIDAWALPSHEDNWRSLCLTDQTPLGVEAPMTVTSNYSLVLESKDLSPLVTDIEGLVVLRFSALPPSIAPSLTTPSPWLTQLQSHQDPSPNSSQQQLYVPTSASRAALRSSSHALTRRLPVLLAGPPSSGKSSLINHLMSCFWSSPLHQHHENVVILDLAARTLDAKSLVGSYVSSIDTQDGQGSFVFAEGPLIRAMREGKWLVCRDIDRASDDVLAVINQVADLMRHRVEYEVGGGVGGHGGPLHGVGVDLGSQLGWVSASERFALLATMTTPADSQQTRHFVGESYWYKVQLPALGDVDVAKILAGLFDGPLGPAVRGCLVRAWKGLSRLTRPMGKDGRRQGVSLRGLLRWARRVEGLLVANQVLESVLSNPIIQESIFFEAIDVFLASSDRLLHDCTTLNKDDEDFAVALSLGTDLGLNEERIRYCLYQRTPDFIAPQDNYRSSTTRKSKNSTTLQIGRVKLPICQPINSLHPTIAYSRPFALTKSSVILLERIAGCIRSSEPILLVGETGTGKTSMVGFLAKTLGKELVCLNLSNQSEASDLLGGFKPLDLNEDAKLTGGAMIDEFTVVFGDQFNISRNQEFIMGMRKALIKKKWARLVTMWKEAIRALSERTMKLAELVQAPSTQDSEFLESATKRRKKSVGFSNSSNGLNVLWQGFLNKVEQFEDQFVRSSSSSQVRFKFVEGPLVKAIQRGDWVLLDEINLGTGDTLESLGSLLQNSCSSLVLSERGDLEPIRRDPGFRLIACMNPATDVGKRDLPPNLRANFTELYVQPPDNDRDALVKIVTQYFGVLCVSDKRVVTDVVDCYGAIRALCAAGTLADGTNSPPHYSMRTLSRALTFTVDVSNSFPLRRALVEGFLMAFVTTLDLLSSQKVKALIDQYFIKTLKDSRAVMNQVPRKPASSESEQFIQVGPFWLRKGPRVENVNQAHSYVLTESVKSKMVDLARAVTTGRFPVLIQGPTSCGKTSIVEYLAAKTGHNFVRINNHEHTDIQEYIGSYVADSDTGQLSFKEGVLVRALRNGEWVVLDELNLAPSDVLEALNRLLDDNRELLIPETQEVVRPHPHFMLFATQNPPGVYGGRKTLSRAFRNRFMELHFDDVPTDELEIILCERCQIAPSYSKRIVQVFTELQRRRQTDRIFEQKQSFVTLRDLFRWGGRGAVGYQQLAEDGYMLLAERARGLEEKAVVKEVLEVVMKVQIDPGRLYEDVMLPNSLVSTAASKRLFKLLSRALEFHEPVLLVGEAGSGKTSVCEAFSECQNQVLRCINLHRNSEVGDLLGSQRPVRNRTGELRVVLDKSISLLNSLGVDPAQFEDFEVNQMIEWVESFQKESRKQGRLEDIDQLETILKTLKQSHALFVWTDGPLVQAMREGNPVLLDEISLADDSVLERLNSLLEPARSIVLAECGGATMKEMQIKAHPTFEIMATMNPGGDFGKRELSPALRNRFTEIWVPLVSEPNDRVAIFAARLSDSTSPNPECLTWAHRIVAFSGYFSALSDSASLACRELSLRDGLAWCDFIKACSTRISAPNAFVDGAQMTVLDRLGTAGFGQDLTSDAIERLRSICFNELHKLADIQPPIHNAPVKVHDTDSSLRIHHFSIPKAAPTSNSQNSHCQYSFNAPTVAQNAFRIIRALQVPKSILLEGSPGVGKTSMVEALARMTGRQLRRINLSDQTDLLDLFGSDVPVEGGRAGEFAWKDAAFLDALQKGHWVLLDEMNLAPQTVLEGLNACLDHRGSVYVPELDRTFFRHADFRVFAAQNPHHQGGSRKGLPRSLVDRFTVVFMKELEKDDLFQICCEIAPGFDRQKIFQMVNLNDRITREIKKHGTFGSCGSPWEFNLRDIARWLQLTTKPSELDRDPNSPLEYMDMIYTGRFRTLADHQFCEKICSEFFDSSSISRDRQDVVELPTDLIIGHSRLPKSRVTGRIPSVASPINVPTSLRKSAESLLRCLELGWLPILTGPEQSGKSSLVKYLASRTGAHLRVISMHSGSDTSDLLGGFEQSNAYRNALQIIENISNVILLRLENQFDISWSSSLTLKASLGRLRILSAAVPSMPLETLAKGIIQVLKDLPEESGVDNSSMALAVHEMQAMAMNCRFEWIDGPLVTAMKQGNWLVIENANLCSASVLDRLNPLFEGNSQLQLTERGIHQGEIVTITPHPNFRIIMIFNPRHGELSRAMRNRGIEINFLSNQDLSNFKLDHLPSEPFGVIPTREIHPQLIFNSPSSSEFIRNLKADAPVRWAAELLIHSPTQYPLLERLLGHASSSSQGANHRLTTAMSLVCQPELRQALESFAIANRMQHIFVGQSMDLALAGRSFQPNLDLSFAETHRLVLTIVLAACCPALSTVVEKRTPFSNLSSSSSSKISKPQDSNPWTWVLEPALISSFLDRANIMIIELATHLLAKSVTKEACEMQSLTICRSLSALQTAIMNLTSLVTQTDPDYASFGFLFQIIHQTLLVMQSLREPEKSIQNIFSLLLPLRSAFDITRWDSMVRLWNRFCPVCPPETALHALIRELEILGAQKLGRTKPELRTLFFEVVGSMKVSYNLKPESLMNFRQVAKQLNEQIIGSVEAGETELARPELSSLGHAFEEIVGVVVVLSHILGSTSVCDTSFRRLLADSRGISSELGVLLYTQHHLKDDADNSDQVLMRIEIEILRSLTTTGSLPNLRLLFGPLNLASQLDGASLLQSSACLTKLVDFLTSLEDYEWMRAMLKKVSRLISSNAHLLDVDRASFPVKLVQRVLSRMEITLGASPHTDSNMALPTNDLVSQNALTLSSCLARAIQLWHLYLPELPIDPLSVSTAQHTYLASSLSQMQQLRELLVGYELTQTGYQSNTRIRILDDDILTTQTSLNALPQPAVQRRSDSRTLMAIFSELKAFEIQFLASDRITNLTTEMEGADDQSILTALQSRLDTFSVSATGLLKRLIHRFPDFVDILRPIQTILEIMIVSLTLKLREATVALFKDSLLPLGDLMTRLLSPTCTIAAADLRSAVCNPNIDKIVKQETSSSIMPILRVGAVACEINGTYNHSDLKLLISAYDSIWKLWSLDRAKEEREAEERAQEFRFRRQEFTVLSDELIEAEELQTLFPTYDDGVSHLMETESGSKSHVVSSTQVDILCHMHLAITLKDEEAGLEKLSWFEKLRKELVMVIAEKHGHLLGYCVDKTSLAFQVNNINHLYASTVVKSKSNSFQDFYRDSNIPEAMQILAPVRSLGFKVKELLEQWPEMIALDEIGQRCHQISQLSCDSPLAKILPFLETLIGQIEEWEKYSCRENSLSSYQAVFTDFVVGWRRLELSSWAGLIERELRTFAQTSNNWWFRLYELLFRGLSTQEVKDSTKDVDRYFGESATVLNEFMSECNLGQFQPRLKLLRSFFSLLQSYSQVLRDEPWMRMCHVVEGIVFFYSHYALEVSAQVEQAKTVARREIENFIRLASWKDVNVFALRQSSHKSHRQLYKSVHRFRAVLQRPVKDLLQTWKPEKSSGLEADLPSVLGHPIDIIVPARETSSMISLPPHLRQPTVALGRLQKFIERRLFANMEIEVPAPEITVIASHVRAVAKELSEEALPQGGAREKFARNLDLRKRKAFASLLKRLKTLGLGSTPTDRILERLKDPAVIFGQPLLGSSSLSCMAKLCEALDDGLYALLSQMPKFRRCRNSHHSDISNSDMQRLIGSVESGLSLILNERQAISALLAAVSKLNQACLRMKELLALDPGHLFAPKTSSTTQSNVVIGYVKITNIFVSALRETYQSIDNLRSNGTVEEIPITVSNLLDESLASATCDFTKLQNMMRIANGTMLLFKADEVELLASIPVRMKGIIGRIRTAAIDAPTLSFIFEPLANDLSRQLSNLPIEFVNPLEESSPVWDTHQSFVDSVLLVAQQLMSRDSNIEGDPRSGSMGELRKGHLTLAAITARCHVEDVLGKLDEFNRDISCTYQSKTGPQIISTVAGFTQQYMNLLANHLKHCLLWHQAQLDLFHTVVSLGINIGENGFCKPDLREEGDNPGEPDGPSVDGTGLGGGQGGKDVSDEIESDEQMEGLQNDIDEQEAGNEEGKEQGRGVKTQLEFDAALEDVEDEGESDLEKEVDEKDEADEIEDEVGKVDPLDSGAVDEKFWEGEDKDEEKQNEDEGEPDLSAKQNQTALDDSTPTAKENQKVGEQNAPDSKEVNDCATDEQEQVSDTEGDDGIEDDDGNDDLAQSDHEAEESSKTNPVPMMDHVDNQETLDLPDDLKLDDLKTENGENDDIEDEGTETDEPQEDHTQGPPESDEGNHQLNPAEESRPLAPSDIPEIESADAFDRGEESGAGAGSGSTNHAPSQSGIDLQSQASKEESKPPQAFPNEQPLTETTQDGESQNETGHNRDCAAAEDVGNGDHGNEPIPRALEAKTHINETAFEEQQTDPNPLRDLGDAMEKWMRRLQQIQDSLSSQTDELKMEASDDPMNLEYLQADAAESANRQQAPGPATQDQAQEALKQLHIDEAPIESEVVRVEDEARLPPTPINCFQLPETNALDQLVEPAITGSTNVAHNRSNDNRGLFDELETSVQPMDLNSASEDEAESTSLLGDEHPNVFESDASAADIWRQYEHITRRSALQLTEQLRLILEPTTATRLEGDYRTGKRLNMRKLVPYLASDYTKDRIWLRRTKPAQRDYQILIAVDDSRSMADSRSAHLALQTVALVTNALAKLEVGEVAISRFGGIFDIIQPFGSRGSSHGENIVKGFTFAQQKTDVRLAIEKAMEMFKTARQQGPNTVNEIWQLGIIVSDGICQDHDQVRALLRRATEKRIMFVFVILDSLHQHGEGDSQEVPALECSSSILSMNTVSYAPGSDGQMVLRMERYLDTFPFDYYIILRDVEALPCVLSGTLRQFFEKSQQV